MNNDQEYREERSANRELQQSLRFTDADIRITILSARQDHVSCGSVQALALTAQAMIMYNNMIDKRWENGTG